MLQLWSGFGPVDRHNSFSEVRAFNPILLFFVKYLMKHGAPNSLLILVTTTALNLISVGSLLNSASALNASGWGSVDAPCICLNMHQTKWLVLVWVEASRTFT